MIQRTIKLYDDNPYEATFESGNWDVLCHNDRIAIVTDRTAFFPEGGGQVCDKGSISIGDINYTVDDVQLEGETIYHYLTEPMSHYDDIVAEASKCGSLKGEIDYDYRFSNMQQHSAEHIFSGLAKKYYDCTNVGFHLSDNEVTFDYDKPLSPKQILFLETQVNKAIYENHIIRAYYPSDEERSALDYRSKKEIQGALRIVEIEGIDVCACCAPHVRTTAEIGICKVTDHINYKGGVRISIVCGERALMHYRQLDDITRDVSKLLSAKRDDLPGEVNRIKRALAEEEYKRIELEHRYLDMIRERIYHKASEADDPKAAHTQSAALTFSKNERDYDINVNSDAIIVRLGDITVRSVRDLVNSLMEIYVSRLIAVITPADTGFFYIMGSKMLDCTKVAAALREKHSAKGGGSKDMIQGKLGIAIDDNDIISIVESVR